MHLLRTGRAKLWFTANSQLATLPSQGSDQLGKLQAVKLGGEGKESALLGLDAWMPLASPSTGTLYPVYSFLN